MRDVDVSIALPHDESPGELMKSYFTLMRAFGWDLYVSSHFALKGELGLHWFADRVDQLKRRDPLNWRPNHRFDPQDPGVILRDLAHEKDSPYVRVFGGTGLMRLAARKILATRNVWFHFGDDPTAAQLIEACSVVRDFVVASGLHMAPSIDALIVRLNKLSAGELMAGGPGEVDKFPLARDAPPLGVPSDLARPSIGGTWTGPIPTMRYRLTRSGDVIDPETLESVRSRVTGDFAEKVRAWTAVEPRGRELWIDSDGAVGGFIGSRPRLLGYLGPDPTNDVVRGFFGRHIYAVDRGAVVNLATGEHRQIPELSQLPDGTSLRVTTYGDVVIDTSDGLERVATVSPREWFPRHLTGE